MEAFTLLKYWRGGGGGGGSALGHPPSSDTPSSRAATTTILTAVGNDNATESDDDNNNNDDDGPFFDLEFTVPDEDAHENPNANHTQEEEEEEDINIEESDGEREFKFTLSPSSNDRSDPNLSPLSPSDDLFFKGKLVHVDPSEPNSKPQFTASLLKSATKFRVFMLGLKKPKPNDKDSNNGSDSAIPEAHKDKKHFTVKFKVEEVPIVSLFSSKAHKNQNQKQTSQDQPSEEKRFSKEVMHKYLKMVKPLYIRVSRRYGDKLSLSSAAKAPPPPPKAEPEGVSVGGGETNVKSSTQAQKLPAGLSVVCKHLGKSRSASSAAVAAAPPAASVSSKRRDDSLLQQQDGIQGAILHCKRSFNASRPECESSQLPRSVSHPWDEIGINEAKDKRLSA